LLVHKHNTHIVNVYNVKCVKSARAHLVPQLNVNTGYIKCGFGLIFKGIWGKMKNIKKKSVLPYRYFPSFKANKKEKQFFKI